MAQHTVRTVGPTGDDVAAQTRYLFNRYVHEVTSDTDAGASLNARAFQEMNTMETRELFGGSGGDVLDEIVDRLKQHARNLHQSLRNDQDLQDLLDMLKENFNEDLLWTLCEKIFNNLEDIWSAIVMLFAFVFELIRKVAIVLYETIVETMTKAVVKWASAWLVDQGGWVAMAAGEGLVSSAVKSVASWFSWLTPSYWYSSQPAPPSKEEAASATKEGSKLD